MGNFGGHALPGSFFLIFGFWHLFQLCINYFRFKRRRGPPYKASSYFSFPCCAKYPIESILKVFFATVGTIGEVVTAVRANTFVNIGNGQHVWMYIFFGFCGILEVLQFYRFHFPYSIIYISYALSFFVEMLLFYWHLHVKEPLEAQVHTLLLYIIAATICSLFAEMTHRTNVLPALLRTYLLILQGIWFWQMAFILFPPEGWKKWDWKSHHQMMLVTIIFCAEIFVTFVIVMLVWFAVARRYNLLRRPVAELKNGFNALPDTESFQQVKLEEEQEEEEALMHGN